MHKRNRTLVLIPSALFIDYELRKEYGHIPPVLMPFEGHKVITELTQRYAHEAMDLFIGSHQGYELLANYCEITRLHVNLINVGKTFDLGHTIYKMLCSIDIESYKEIIINFGDTLLSSPFLTEQHDTPYDHLYTSKVQDTWHWTIIDPKTPSLSFIHKEGQDNGQPNDAVVGVIQLSSPLRFKALLTYVISQSFELNTESLFEALKQYDQAIPIKIIAVDSKDWIDVGHLEQIDKLRATLLAREFNTLQIDQNKGIIIKKSENKKKLLDEINWYLSLPKELHYSSPRILDYSCSPEDPFIMMDYYGYPSLADMFVHGSIPIQKWQLIFKQLQWLLNEWKSFSGDEDDETTYHYQYEMYVTKTKTRLQQCPLTDELKAVASCQSINGKEVMSLEQIVDALDSLFLTMIDGQKQKTSIIHGDFCLSNILFDTRQNTFRVIDPRGSFGVPSIYGDPHYDVAKLRHSVVGLYDFIVREQFYYERNNQHIQFMPFSTSNHQSIQNAFEELVLINYHLPTIQYIEALLFLSMLPLHQDSPTRQIGLLIKGMELFTQVYEQYK